MFQRLTILLVGSLVAILVSGCGGSTATASPARSVAAASGIQLAVASSDLAVGHNRFAFGLLDNNHPMTLKSAQATFYRRQGNAAIRTQTLTARFNFFARGLKDTDKSGTAVEIGGVFVTNPTFTRPGGWAVQARFRYKGKIQTVSAQFPVPRKSSTPAIGSSAPRSHNPTIAQLPASKLDSGHPPDDMHRLSIASALAQHKPLVVLFATAAFCTSRMCGPEIQVVQGLERKYRGRVNFVHIEIYKNAQPPQFAPTVVQWGLQSEPWVFVINKTGVISAKFDGPTPGSEIDPALRRALA